MYCRRKQTIKRQSLPATQLYTHLGEFMNSRQNGGNRRHHFESSHVKPWPNEMQVDASSTWQKNLHRLAKGGQMRRKSMQAHASFVKTFSFLDGSESETE